MKVEPLRPSEVHVGSISLRQPAEQVETLRRELAADEGERAQRMRTPDLARRFIVARGVLRRLLAAHLPGGKVPARFVYGTRGKPFLAPEFAALADLSFNVAHADDVAVYAIAIGRAVGIDVEATERDGPGSAQDDGKFLQDVEIDGIAKKVFSAHECEALRALPLDERRSAFFRTWARKEAYIKALGQGFGYPTRSFSVSHCADDDALVDDESDSDAVQRWRVIGLSPPPGFAMALAAEGRDWSVRRFDASAVL